jgi:hypothetical protein
MVPLGEYHDGSAEAGGDSVRFKTSGGSEAHIFDEFVRAEDEPVGGVNTGYRPSEGIFQQLNRGAASRQERARILNQSGCALDEIVLRDVAHDEGLLRPSERRSYYLCTSSGRYWEGGMVGGQGLEPRTSCV